MLIPQKLIEILKNANYVVVLTGAGVSAESGIKTFRDPDGLWSKFEPAELASINGFMSNPELVWDWYQHRREIIANSKPNAGHLAIAEMENIFKRFLLITQNVDRLHQNAGSKNIRELHGNIIDNHCFNCEEPYLDEINLSVQKIPNCPNCGGLIRPSVVWFGEMLPEKALRDSEDAASECDVFFSIGTSAEVYPAANLPIIAKQNGAIVIEVNPNKTQLSNMVDYHINEPSAIAMPELLLNLKNYKGVLNI